MIRVCTRWVLLASIGASASGAHAQPPIQLNNTPQALRQYELSTLEGLRQRCTSSKDAGIATAPEVLQLRTGFAEFEGPAPASGVYATYLYDQDRRSFVLIEGQLLQADERLHLRLALPRDYARCRIVQDSQGMQRLEVVHTERNYVSDAQQAQRLLGDAQGSASPANACISSPTPAPTGGAGRYRVDPQGWWPLPACHPGLDALGKRLSRLVRRAAGR